MQNKIIKSYQVKVNNLVVQLALFNVLNEDSRSSNLYFPNIELFKKLKIIWIGVTHSISFYPLFFFLINHLIKQKMHSSQN